jgi:hypothetical protein
MFNEGIWAVDPMGGNSIPHWTHFNRFETN